MPPTAKAGLICAHRAYANTGLVFERPQDANKGVHVPAYTAATVPARL